MTRVDVGAMCVAVLITAFQRRRKRRTLGAFALEQIEYLFDAIQSIFSPKIRSSPGTKGAGQ